MLTDSRRYIGGSTRDNNSLKLGLPHQPVRRLPLSTLSTTELIKVRNALARALSVDDVNQLGRDTGQATRLRTVTPHRLFLAVVSTLASAHVESLADLLRAFNHQNGVTVAYKAFYNLSSANIPCGRIPRDWGARRRQSRSCAT